MPKQDRHDDICVGIIKGAFGVRGDVRIHPLTENPKDMATFGPLHTHTGLSGITVTLERPISHGHFCSQLSCIQTREEGEALKGTKLYAPRSVLPVPDEDDFYYSDLEGLDVVHNGEKIGKIASVQDFGAGDLLEIHRTNNGAILYITFTKDCVPVVNINAGFVEITPPEGTM